MLLPPVLCCSSALAHQLSCLCLPISLVQLGARGLLTAPWPDQKETRVRDDLNHALPARNGSISFRPLGSLITPGNAFVAANVIGGNSLVVNIWISLNLWLMMLLCPISFAVSLLHRFPNRLSLPCRHTEDPTSDSRGNFLVVCLGEGKLLSCVFTAAARKGHLEVSMTAPSHCWSHKLRLGTL